MALSTEFIDLEPHIDYEGFKKLRVDVAAGIVLSEWVPTTNPFTYDERYFDAQAAIQKIEALPVDVEVRQKYDELCVQYFDSKIARQKALYTFACLTQGHYYGMFTIPIVWRSVGLTKNAEHFKTLLEWIDQLPFKQISRVVIYVNTSNAFTPLHRDREIATTPIDFLWCTTEGKKLYILSEGQKQYAPSNAVMWDERHWHGTDPSHKMQWALRIDGIYQEGFLESVASNHP